MSVAFYVQKYEAKRTGFHTPRSVNPETRSPLRKSTRLMDYCLGTLEIGDCDYLTEVTPAEFAVVDMKTGEKGWFEWQQGTTPDEIHAMIEGCFNSAARRVAFRVWAV